MGIDVDAAKVVTYNPTHEHRVATDPARPFPTARYGSLEVVSIFRRRRAKHDDDDGNPLIYALKDKFGYTIALADVRQLLMAGQQILPAALATLAFDIVVPVPSSSPVASIVARRASRAGGPYPIVECLDKATVAQVLAQAPAPDQVKSRDRGFYTSQLARMQETPGNEFIEMKSVPLRVRRYFTPIAANALAPACAGLHVLVVDDIVGSGTSLVAAQSALLAAGAAGISAMTLLSRLS